MKTEFQKLDEAASGADAAAMVDYSTFPNAMPASQEAAPRLGRAYATGTVGQKEVYERMKELGYQMGEAEAVRVWNAMGFVLKNRMPKDGRAYDLGFVRFFPVMGGTFDSADADFDPSRNRLYVAAAPSAELRNALADGTPTRTGEMATDDARITNVTWGTMVDAKTIKSGEPFHILGSGLTIGAGDEHAELALPDSSGMTTVSVALSEPDDAKGLGQRLVGQLSQPVQACEGAVLAVWTHGFDSSGTLQKVSLGGLTVIPAPPPAPTITSVTGEGTDNVNLGGCDVSATGENLETATRMEFVETEDGEAFYAMDVEYADGTLSGFADFIGTAPDNGFVRVTTAGGTATRAVTFSNH